MSELTRKYPFFISCPRNLEKLLGHELIELGIKQIRPERLGVYTELDRAEVYKVVYCTRIGSRILRPLANFPCPNPEALYERASQMPWDKVLSLDKTFRIDSAIFNTKGLTHSQYAALKLKDAICDFFMDLKGARPSVDKETPDVPLHLHVEGSKATLSLNYSGGVSHRRGYRHAMVTAPLKENLGAALLRFAGFDGSYPLVDLFTGSGTFLIEAAMIYTNTPAGIFKQVQGFQNLMDYDKVVWSETKEELHKAIKPLPANWIMGIDIDKQATLAAKTNLSKTPWHSNIAVTTQDCLTLNGLPENALIVANPPYGERLGVKDVNLFTLYQQLGSKLAEAWSIKGALILFPDEVLQTEFEKGFKKRPNRAIEVDNGTLKIKVCYYEPK